MTPEQVVDHPARVLDQRVWKRYFDHGFLTVPGYVAPAWLDRLRAVVAAKIEASRALSAIFSAQAPPSRPVLVDQTPARPAP
jgi:hypothetical protein